MQPFSLNIKGKLHDFRSPLVMGIINVTPDSFYTESRAATALDISRRCESMLAEGADIIDVGAYSTRPPGFADVSLEEETARLEIAIKAIRDVSSNAIISVDTFRAAVAEQAIADFGADIVNDISAGTADAAMPAIVAKLKVPYIIMHMRGSISTMHEPQHYDSIVAEVLSEMSRRVAQLRLMGINDVIVDPGFGFCKDVEQCYELLKGLEAFSALGAPVLVGLSRKRMVTQVLGIKPEDALVGTSLLNMQALMRGASILRVHDVAAAVQTIKIYLQLI